MNVDKQLLEVPDDTKNANSVKEEILERLLIDKKINKETFDHYNYNWHVIILKKSWFRKWKDIWSNKEDGYIYKYVKF
jgi:hypothetical protein